MWNLLRRSLKVGRVTETNRPLSSPARAAERPRAFSQSLHMRHLDCGSCNGCDWELTALGNAFYDIQHFGFDFVASPRHADLLMCTGPGSTQLLAAAHETYDAMPSPKWVIAVGDCAINGGKFKAAYASESGIDGALPVDFEIPGCPPSPQDIIDALLGIVGKKKENQT